ncbi:MAG TPA: hypothetical protein VNW97_20885, partial [Candidatus Saccharimonadales bacterium]|nr:hypothetical protein [Candidatus Saccharimonadales bacterium]
MRTKDTGHERVFGRLAALPDDASRIKFLSRYPRLVSPAFVVRLDEEVRVLVRIDLKKAHALAEAALTIATQLGDKESLAYALRAKANALWCLGKNRQASELHVRS